MSLFVPETELPCCDLPLDLDLSTSALFTQIFENPDRAPIYLVEAWPYSRAAPETMPGLPEPGCVSPALSSFEFDTYDGEVPLRLSDRGWCARPDDPVLPSANFPARISARGFTLSAVLFSGTDPTSPGNSRGSEIDILYDTADPAQRAEADQWTRMGWDGRRLAVRAGLPEFEYEDFGMVAAWSAAGIAIGEGVATILPRDRNDLLSRDLTQSLYAGTGGAEGHAALAGAVKPLAFGRVRNATPVLLDQANRIYQLHDGAVAAVTAVRDRGVPLSFHADHADFAALAAASIPGGSYGTCLAGGYLRLGAEPAGGVTCDLRGDARGGYVESCGGILRRIMTTRLGARVLQDPEDIDAVAFAALDLAWPAPCGFYTADRIAVSDAVNRIEKSFYGKAFFTRAGLLSVKRFERPLSPPYSLTGKTVAEAGVSIDAAAPPPWRIRVGYSRNHTLQGANDLAGEAEAAPDARELYGTSYLHATAADAAVRTRHRLSPTLDWPTLLALEADAAALAGRILGFSIPPLMRRRVTGLSALLRFWIGDAVTLDVTAPGIPAGGLKGLVAAISENYADGTVDIEMVG